MNEGDFDGFTSMIRSVAAHVSAGRNQIELSAQQIAFYFEGLRHYDLDAIRSALNIHVRNPDVGSFMPKIADIVRALEGSNLDAATRAWSLVLEGMRRAGQYQSIAFDDPTINRVIMEMGGWPSLFVLEKEAPFRQKEFENRYRGWRTRGGPSEWPAYLPGIAEASNRANGYKKEEGIVLVGDRSKALAISKGESLALPAPS